VIPSVPARGSAEIDLFRQLLAARSGISFGQSRESFLEGRLRRRMAKTGARSLYEYYRMVTAPGAGMSELQALVDEVSVNETSFFRNPTHFESLGRDVLPQRMRERQTAGSRTLRLWSAGCSTGQELYSLAMVFFESVVFHETWDVALVGTDVSARAVEHARRAEYDERQMENVSAERRRRFFERSAGRYTVRSWARRGVEVVRGSLFDGPPWKDADVVLCRNVMIYFDQDHQRRLARRLAEAVAPGGYLFLGHTESLRGISDAFRMVSLRPGVAYQRLP
jgi:chemotaxis protein methyltransferase CheR